MIHRRGFLSSLVALAGRRPASRLAASLGVHAGDGRYARDGSSAGRRQAPRDPILLQSKSLSVTLDAGDGLPYRYTWGGESIWGEDVGTPVTAILCQLNPRLYKTVSLKVASVDRARQSILFGFNARWEDRLAARFSLKYAIDADSLVLNMESVAEEPGYELIEVALPSLVTVRDTDPSAWLAQGRNGGSFARLAEAKPYVFEDDENFGRISIQLPMGMVGSGGIGCVMEVSAFMDGTETSVVRPEGMNAEESLTEAIRSARIGTVQVYRVHGGRCYNMNDGGDAVCGTAGTPNLLVGQTSRCRFDFFKVKDGAVPWWPGAKLLSSRMPLTPAHYFDDKFLYLIAGRNKTEAAPRTTFAQSRQLIREIAYLTDFAPQVPLISGWVYDGQDTGYPSEDVVNPSLGSYEQLMKLKNDSRSLNANVSVNVNYDDAYKSSPQFSLDFIAREPNGAVWKSRAWDGEDSYIVGMAKFVAGGWARRRIDATMARYQLRDAMLIDALSWFTIRNDWDPKHPASGYKNLTEGKWIILDEFCKRGVNVASEQFRYPMLGKLALTVDGPEPASCPFGGQQVPLTAIVYRKATIFGSGGGGKLRPHQDLFWNSRPGVWYEHKTDRREITDFYYLVVLPYNKIHALDGFSYATEGPRRTLHLEDHSSVTNYVSGESYEVIWKGNRIAGDGATTCPVDDNRIAFYSRLGGSLAFPLPPSWKPGDVTARSLHNEGRQSFAVKIVAEQIIVKAPAQVPVMVYAAERFIPQAET